MTFPPAPDAEFDALALLEAIHAEVDATTARDADGVATRLADTEFILAHCDAATVARVLACYLDVLLRDVPGAFAEFAAGQRARMEREAEA